MNLYEVIIKEARRTIKQSISETSDNVRTYVKRNKTLILMKRKFLIYLPILRVETRKNKMWYSNVRNKIRI